MEGEMGREKGEGEGLRATGESRSGADSVEPRGAGRWAGGCSFLRRKRGEVVKGEGVERIGRDVVDRLRRTRMMRRSSDRIGPWC